MNEIMVQNQNGKVVVSSREIASNFGKRHTHLLDVIKGFSEDLSTAEFSALFQSVGYKASNGKMNYEYLVNRDGFSLLAMGFTGKKALQWKLKYIEAFNEMEEKLKHSNQLSEEEKLKLMLFSKDPMEVVSAHNKLVELEVAPLIAENKELRPKAEFHDTVQASTNSISVGKFSAVLQKNEIFKNLGRNKLFSWLRDNGYLCEYGDLKNKPTQKSLSSGYMDYNEYVTENSYGKYITTYKPLITGKGQIYFTEKFLKEFSQGVALLA